MLSCILDDEMLALALFNQACETAGIPVSVTTSLRAHI